MTHDPELYVSKFKI